MVQILGLVISTLFLLKSHDLKYEDEKIRQMNLDEYGQTIVPFSISGKSSLMTSLLIHLENMLKPGSHKLKEEQGKANLETERCLFSDFPGSLPKKGQNYNMLICSILFLTLIIPQRQLNNSNVLIKATDLKN